MDRRLMNIEHHGPRLVYTFKYIHIWTSDDEVRIKCTDPDTIMAIVDAIDETHHFELEEHEDLTDQVNYVRLTGFADEDRNHEIGWWMFKVLLERGWEPMETKEHSYKLKYMDVRESPYM